MSIHIAKLYRKTDADALSVKRLLISVFILGFSPLAGCGSHTFESLTAAALHGQVLGGGKALFGSSIQVYAMGTVGDGSPATPLLAQPVVTDENGNFSISEQFVCPSRSSQLFLMATNGKTSPLTVDNTAISEITILGKCETLSFSSPVTINEVTTVGAVWSLENFMAGNTQVGSAADHIPALNDAVEDIYKLVDTRLGTTPGPMLPSTASAPVSKLNTLSNLLAGCINTLGGAAGDGTFCGQLFSLATSPGGRSPTNTLDAAINIAHNPAAQVGPLFDLASVQQTFTPTLASAPVDWQLPIETAEVTGVTLSPTSVSLEALQTVSFTSSINGVQNGNMLWSFSPPIGNISATGTYTAPATVAIGQTITVKATSTVDPSKFANATIVLSPTVSVTVTGPASMTANETRQFFAAVSGSSNTQVVWSLSPTLGEISSNGLYTPPDAINSSQTVAVIATSVVDPSKSASTLVSLTPAAGQFKPGKTYYLSPGGADTNSGLTQSNSWRTPNHSGLKCGDAIIAAPGTYNAFTVTATPSCSGHDAVWVECASFDSCKINQDLWTQGGINVQASYWAFVGWEVTAKSGPYAACFSAVPGSKATASIHDVYFINDIANGCMAGGFISAPTGQAGVDYFLVIADAVYNAAQSSAYCNSGVSVWEPIATDSMAGTHIYVSQVFAWHNLEPPTCAGNNSTDGEGIIFDTFNGSQSGLPAYSHQAVIENVITVYNGAYGVLAGGGSGNSAAPMFVKNATSYGNFINTNQNQYFCAQMASFGWPTTDSANLNRFTTFDNNLAISQSSHLPGCGNNVPYAYYFGNIDGTDSFAGNAGYSASGQSVGYAGTNAGFVKGSNVVGQNPLLANPVEPPAPSCSGKANVIDCMSGLIANFRPTNRTFTSYGYQPPSTQPIHDQLFPRWLCDNPNMPKGVVTMGCLD